MLEQEIASLMRFTLDSADNPSPYYYEVPQDFLVPAVFFPPPEVDSRGDTLSTYALEYSIFIKFFHSSTPLAHAMGMDVMTTMLKKRRLIPLLDSDGGLAGKGFRIKDPKLKAVSGSSGVVQMEVTWDSYRPYNDPLYSKITTVNLTMSGRDAYRAAVEQMQKEDEPIE